MKAREPKHEAASEVPIQRPAPAKALALEPRTEPDRSRGRQAALPSRNLRRLPTAATPGLRLRSSSCALRRHRGRVLPILLVGTSDF